MKSPGLLFVWWICFCQASDERSAQALHSADQIDHVKVVSEDSAPGSDRSGEILGRPELSVPLYSIVRRYEPGVSLGQLDRWILHEVGEGRDEAMALVAAGAKASATLLPVMLDPTRPRSIPIPSLLIVPKTAQRGRDGALLLVDARAADQLQIYDFQSGKGRGYLPFSDLPIIWSGDAIVVQDRAGVWMGWWVATTGLFLVIAARAVAWFRDERVRAPRATPAVTIVIPLAAAFLSCGCRQANDHEDTLSRLPVSSIHGAVLDLGTLKGDDSDQCDFSMGLRVDHPAPVRIDRLPGNCSCLTLGENLAGTVRQPREQFKLTGRLRLDGKIGEHLLILQMQTSGLDGNSLTQSKFGLRFVVHPRPMVDVERLVLCRFEGDSDWRGRLSMILHRLPEHPPLKLDLHRSSHGLLTVSCPVQQTGLAMEGSRVLRDLMELEFATKSIDCLPARLQLAAVGYERTVEVPLTTEVQQPLVSEPASLFLGIVESGKPVEKSVRLEDRAKRGVDLKRIELAAGCADAKLVSTSLESTTATARILFRPAGMPGRGAGEVVLELGGVANVRIPVTWVIR